MSTMVREQEISTTAIANLEEQGKEVKRVVFFAGDAIPPSEKYEMPDVKAGGGIYLPHMRTVQATTSPATQGLVRRCKFTSMQVAMELQNEQMLPPWDRKSYPQAYIRTVADENGNGVQETVSGFLGADAASIKEGIFKNVRQGDVRYSKVYPGDEVKRIIQRSQPNGVGGVVEIQALKGASASEIEEAQHYFFPNWDSIAEGAETLPTAIKDIEVLIKSRMADVDNQLWPEAKKAQYLSIGKDMLQSCEQFAFTSLQILEKDEVIKKEADAKGVVAPHSAISEHLLSQIDRKRKGDILSGEFSATNDLVKEMRADRDSMNASKAKELELREREIALQEKTLELQLQIAKAAAATPVTDTVSAPVEEPVEQTDIALDSPINVQQGAPPPKGKK